MTEGFRFEPQSRGHSTPNLDLRFAFWAAAWRITLGVFLVREALFFWKSLRSPRGISAGLARAFFKVPESLFVAAAAGLGAALLLWLFVRLLTEPRIRRWLTPRGENSFATPYAFRLSPGERAEAEWPARRWVGGRSWRAGVLVLTDRALVLPSRLGWRALVGRPRPRLPEFVGSSPRLGGFPGAMSPACPIAWPIDAASRPRRSPCSTPNPS
ncbi:MAG: hypothetical protein U0800_14790 [Isosphaeraceae bacterium]